MGNQQSSDNDIKRTDADRPVTCPKEMDRHLSHTQVSTDNTGARPKEMDRHLSHAQASTDNTGARPKEMDRHLSHAQASTDNTGARPKEMDRHLSHAQASTDNTGAHPKVMDRHLSHAQASTDITGARPKVLDRQASFAHDAKTGRPDILDVRPKKKDNKSLHARDARVDLSTYTDAFEILAEKNELGEYRGCTKNPGHTNMKRIKNLKVEDLPFRFQTQENYDKVMEQSKRTARVVVPRASRSKTSCGSEQNQGEEGQGCGTGFVFPGVFHEKEPCPCRECKISGKAKIGYHTAYVLTARHVVYNEMEAMTCECDLFYDEYYRTGVKKLYGVGMAGDEKCIRYNEDGDVVFVANDDSNDFANGSSGNGGQGGGSDKKAHGGDSDTKGQSGGSDTKGQSGGSDTKGQSGGSDTKGQSGGSVSKGQSGGSDTKGQSGGSVSKGQSGGSDTKGQSGGSDTKGQSGGSDTKGQSGDSDTKGQSGGSDTKGQSGGSVSKGQSGGSDTKGQSCGSDTKGQNGGSDTKGQSGGSNTKGQSGGSDTKGQSGGSVTKGQNGGSDTKGHSGGSDTKGHSGGGDTKGQMDDIGSKGQDDNNRTDGQGSQNSGDVLAATNDCDRTGGEWIGRDRSDMCTNLIDGGDGGTANCDESVAVLTCGGYDELCATGDLLRDCFDLCQYADGTHRNTAGWESLFLLKQLGDACRKKTIELRLLIETAAVGTRQESVEKAAGSAHGEVVKTSLDSTRESMDTSALKSTHEGTETSAISPTDKCVDSDQSLFDHGNPSTLELTTFLRHICQGSFQDALEFAKPRFIHFHNIYEIFDDEATDCNPENQDIFHSLESKLQAIKDTASSFRRLLSEGDTCLLNSIHLTNLQCTEFLAMSEHFVEDMNLYKSVQELSGMIITTEEFFKVFDVFLYRLSLGDFKCFVDGKVFSPTPISNESHHCDSSEESDSSLHEDSIGVDKTIIAVSKKLSSVKSRYSHLLQTFLEKDRFLFLNILIPILVDDTCIKSHQLLAGVKDFLCTFQRIGCCIFNLFQEVFDNGMEIDEMKRDLFESCSERTTNRNAFELLVNVANEFLCEAESRAYEEGDGAYDGSLDVDTCGIDDTDMHYGEGSDVGNDGCFDDTIDPTLITLCEVAVSFFGKVSIGITKITAELKEAIKAAEVDVAKGSQSDANESLSISSLATFVDFVNQGRSEEALLLATERLLVTKGDKENFASENKGSISDHEFNKITESAKMFCNFLDKECERLLFHLDAAVPHCLSLSVMAKYFLKDQTLYETIIKLRNLLSDTCKFFYDLKRVLQTLTLGDVKIFIDISEAILFVKPESGDLIRNENAEDSTIHKLHLNCDGIDVNNIDKMCQLLLHVTTLYCQSLRKFNQMDRQMYLNIIAPLFVDENYTERSGLLAAFQRFWNFFNKDILGLRYMLSASMIMESNLASIIDTISTSCLIDTSDSHFLTGHHAEFFDYLNFERRITSKTTIIGGEFERYKTDSVLVKCVTHDSNLINDYLKKIDFFPPRLPFTFIISHPHGYIKHIGFGEMTNVSAGDGQWYYTVTLTTEAQFRVAEQCTASEDMAKFMRLLKSKRDDFGEIREKEIYYLPCELTLAFQTTGERHPVVDSNGWLKFPANTVWVKDKNTSEVFVLSENVEFYSPVDIFKTLNLERPGCFTHNVPTCKGSSGALIQFHELEEKHYYVHCGWIEPNGEVLGLSSISNDIWESGRSDLFSLKEILKVTTTLFSGAGRFEYHSGDLFQ